MFKKEKKLKIPKKRKSTFDQRKMRLNVSKDKVY